MRSRKESSQSQSKEGREGRLIIVSNAGNGGVASGQPYALALEYVEQTMAAMQREQTPNDVLTEYLSETIQKANNNAMELLKEHKPRGCIHLLTRAAGLLQKQEKPELLKLLNLTYNNLAFAYKTVGRPRQALRCLEKALDSCTKAGDNSDVAMTCINMSAVQSELGDHIRAQASARRAASQCENDLLILSARLRADPQSQSLQQEKREKTSLLSIAYYNLGIQEEALSGNQLALVWYNKARKDMEAANEADAIVCRGNTPRRRSSRHGQVKPRQKYLTPATYLRRQGHVLPGRKKMRSEVLGVLSHSPAHFVSPHREVPLKDDIHRTTRRLSEVQMKSRNTRIPQRNTVKRARCASAPLRRESRPKTREQCRAYDDAHTNCRWSDEGSIAEFAPVTGNTCDARSPHKRDLGAVAKPWIDNVHMALNPDSNSSLKLKGHPNLTLNPDSEDDIHTLQQLGFLEWTESENAPLQSTSPQLVAPVEDTEESFNRSSSTPAAKSDACIDTEESPEQWAGLEMVISSPMVTTSSPAKGQRRERESQRYNYARDRNQNPDEDQSKDQDREIVHSNSKLWLETTNYKYVKAIPQNYAKANGKHDNRSRSESEGKVNLEPESNIEGQTIQSPEVQLGKGGNNGQEKGTAKKKIVIVAAPGLKGQTRNNAMTQLNFKSTPKTDTIPISGSTSILKHTLNPTSNVNPKSKTNSSPITNIGGLEAPLNPDPSSKSKSKSIQKPESKSPKQSNSPSKSKKKFKSLSTAKPAVRGIEANSKAKKDPKGLPASKSVVNSSSNPQLRRDSSSTLKPKSSSALNAHIEQEASPIEMDVHLAQEKTKRQRQEGAAIQIQKVYRGHKLRMANATGKHKTANWQLVYEGNYKGAEDASTRSTVTILYDTANQLLAVKLKDGITNTQTFYWQQFIHAVTTPSHEQFKLLWTPIQTQSVGKITDDCTKYLESIRQHIDQTEEQQLVSIMQKIPTQDENSAEPELRPLGERIGANKDESASLEPLHQPDTQRGEEEPQISPLAKDYREEDNEDIPDNSLSRATIQELGSIQEADPDVSDSAYDLLQLASKASVPEPAAPATVARATENELPVATSSRTGTVKGLSAQEKTVELEPLADHTTYKDAQSDSHRLILPKAVAKQS